MIECFIFVCLSSILLVIGFFIGTGFMLYGLKESGIDVHYENGKWRLKNGN